VRLEIKIHLRGGHGDLFSPVLIVRGIEGLDSVVDSALSSGVHNFDV